ncbi:MAG: SufD family Fe-S cluster assembly protein [Candidatus Aenigmarchaeota archaeon]|nr:SufD family Fe-S cluster assembly protein [Candidatus Aenigmarchaeota archaeon]
MSLDAVVEGLSERESVWFRSFRQRNLSRFRSLAWDKSKYASLSLEERELQAEQIPSPFDAVVPEGAIFDNAFSALEAYPELMTFAEEESKYAAMNNALCNAGFVLRIPSGMSAAVPLRAFAAKPCFARSVIIVENGATLNLVQSLASENAGVWSMHVDVYVRDGASLQYTTLQNLDQQTKGIMAQRVFLGRDAKLAWVTGTLGGSTVRARRDIMLQGKGAEAQDLEIFFGSGAQTFELHTNIRHETPHTKGYSTTKGILGGSARALTQGLARIEKGADGSDSFLGEHILLVSSQAKAEPMPFMEIEANDIKAKHSGFVSPIDEEKIFYLRSRGIDRNDARRLVALGFLAPALQVAGDASKELNRLIEEKWQQ